MHYSEPADYTSRDSDCETSANGQGTFELTHSFTNESLEPLLLAIDIQIPTLQKIVALPILSTLSEARDRLPQNRQLSRSTSLRKFHSSRNRNSLYFSGFHAFRIPQFLHLSSPKKSLETCQVKVCVPDVLQARISRANLGNRGWQKSKNERVAKGRKRRFRVVKKLVLGVSFSLFPLAAPRLPPPAAPSPFFGILSAPPHSWPISQSPPNFMIR